MKPIEKMLIDMARFYNYALEKRQLELYVEVLGQFPEGLVLQAGKEYVQDPKNERFPIPPHKIMAKHLPQKASSIDVGRVTALRIREAISKFGWPHPRQAAEFIGSTGWGIVERLGGWQHLCENLGTNIPESTFMAQCRDAAESVHRLGEQGFDLSHPALEEKRDGKPLDLAPADFRKLVPSKDK